MKSPTRFLARIAMLLAAGSFAAAGVDFALRDGDRVVFYGDSITDQRLYTTFAETYVVTRFPRLDFRFVHSGWGGDRVTGGGGGRIDLRLTRDVFAYRPTVITIMLGMNDGSYRAFDQGIFDTYAGGYQHIMDALKHELPGIRILAIQPSPFDDVTRAPAFAGGYNAVLLRYGQFVTELAGREGMSVADLNGPIVAALEKAKAADPDLATKIIPDRVHPGPGGHLLMAGCLLKAWQAPAAVTSVELDASAGKVLQAERTKVGDLKTAGTLSWSQQDECLPMPVDLDDPVISLAVKSSDFMETLNRESLRVVGLTDARYGLVIDDAEVGAFTRAELEAGINLALLTTPMSRQAANVHQLTLRHDNLHFIRWRQVQVPLAADRSSRVQEATRELMAALDEEEDEVVRQQRAAAQPEMHRYQLVPR